MKEPPNGIDRVEPVGARNRWTRRRSRRGRKLREVNIGAEDERLIVDPEELISREQTVLVQFVAMQRAALVGLKDRIAIIEN